MTKKKHPESDEARKEARNEDPVTGAPGSHPVGAGVGAALGGAAAGAAAGAVAGPVGAAVGAVVGGVAGGYGGKAVAEHLDPTVEAGYWRETYSSRPYYHAPYDFEVYEPAYRLGWEAYDPNETFENREAELQRRWKTDYSDNKLTWEEAKAAMKDSWHRVAGRTGESPVNRPR
ncbi:MAG: hypothetical protein ACYC6N_19030 [Pirellulaceae bacterium]